MNNPHRISGVDFFWKSFQQSDWYKTSNR